MADTQIGVLTEIGDLGLGFTPLTEEETESLKKEQEKENK